MELLGPERAPIVGRVVALGERWPLAIVAVVLALTMASAIALFRFDPASQLEHDFSKLRRIDTWTSGDGYWCRKVDELLGRYVTPTVVLSDSPANSSACRAGD